MGRHNRKCYSGILNHCYQNTIEGKLIFYTISDFLVYFTIFCTITPRYKVTVVGLTLMYDHIHKSMSADSRKELYRCSQNITSVFAKEHNKTLKRKGSLFRKPFGSVPKYSDKKARSNIIYLANNPVERSIVKYAEEYRWNFLAYYNSNHPFSKKISKHSASKYLLWAMKVVDKKRKNSEYLTNPLLQTLFKKLSKTEKEQLVDYIISVYNVIDYQTAIRFWGSYEKMIIAIHSTTGEEYDLNEVFVGKRDDVYPTLTSLVLQSGKYKDIHYVVSLSAEEKIELFYYLQGRSSATAEQIAKYLHMRLEKS